MACQGECDEKAKKKLKYCPPMI